MDKTHCRRIVPLVAFVLIITVFALALTTLLTGITGNSPNAAAILTFNTSSLGLEEYRDIASPLHSNITDLIPHDLTSPPSINQYLGTRDWYTVHYFTNCSGFFAPSTTNPSILTANKINITCTRQVSGYFFKPHIVIQSQLLPGLKDLADSVSTAEYMTSTWSGLWYSGIGNLVAAAFSLTLNLTWRWPGLYFWIAWNAFISTVLFLSSSSMVTNTIIAVHHAEGIPGMNPWPATFLGIMWGTTTLMGIVCGLMVVQWRWEGSHGQCCREELQPIVRGDRMQLGSWKSETTLVGRKNS